MQGGYFKKMQKNEMDEKVIQMRNLPFQVDGQVMVYTMPQEVDHHVAQTLCAELDQLISSYQIKELVLDFEKAQREYSAFTWRYRGIGKSPLVRTWHQRRI